MGYYGQGEMHRGDYYRGDPFLGALVGGLVGKAAQWVGKRVLGSGAKRAVQNLPGVGVIAGSILPSMSPINLGPVKINPGNILPGGEPFVEMSGKKRRRLNVLNPRALKRALRRAEGFEKFARRTVNALYRTSGGTKKRIFKKKTPRS